MATVSLQQRLGKATVVAPSNIAFVKYWGSTDPEAGVPMNASISMTLSRCMAACTLERIPGGDGVEVLLRRDGCLAPAPPGLRDPVRRQVERLCRDAGNGCGYRAALEVGFPVAAGLASSAAIFAAVTLAAHELLDPGADTGRLAEQTRRSGSGSAARSLLGGYVEWRPLGPEERDDGEPRATELRHLAPCGHWTLCDVIAVVDPAPKKVSSREGHRRCFTSPYFQRRLDRIPRRLRAVRTALAARDLSRLGPVLEEEAVDLHLVAMSSRPPVFYWRPGTVEVLDAVRSLREEGVPAYATLDAGPNVHVICEPAHERAVVERLEGMEAVERIIPDRVGPGPSLSPSHLF